MRWLLLDEIVSVERRLRAKSRSRVPDAPFSPEVLMIEMMAQTGALLIGAETDYKEDLIFAKIEEAEFEHPLSPGENLEIEVTSQDVRPAGAWLDGIIRMAGKSIAKSRFLLMNVGPLIPENREPVSFHRDFMEHFRIREKVT